MFFKYISSFIKPAQIKKIIHIDMDAFFASVEQRDFPELRGKPIAVGGSSERGVVAAASYEARKFGVKSAMASVIAKRRCPDLIFVKHRFHVYKEVSQQIKDIFFEYTDLVEPLSLDEAYLDVTENKIGLPSATLIAREIKLKIKERTNLTASAGISFNKFLAKTASDIKKPDGLFVILPEEADDFIKKLPVHKFHGIGKKTAEKMNKMGIFTGNDLKKKSLESLIVNFGKAGKYYFDISRGNDNRLVNPSRERKSVSAENTFSTDLTNLQQVGEEVEKIAETVFKRIEKSNLYGRTIHIKVKYSDFHQITRSKTNNFLIKDLETLNSVLKEILQEKELMKKSIRLLGVGVSNFNIENRQLPRQLTLGF